MDQAFRFWTDAASPSQPAQQLTRSGSFELACNPDKAFPFFSPEGEREWVNGWNPRPVFPETIEFRPETVFREGNGPEEALWTIVDVDWQRHRAEYVRVAPASHSAHVVVEIQPIAKERCRAAVRYTVTGFGEGSTALLEKFSEEAYAQKMRDWERLITGVLGNAG